MRFWIQIVLIALSLSAHAESGQSMFNACDSCSSWNAKRTALYLENLDSAQQEYEFESVGPTVILQPPKNQCSEDVTGFAIFFEDKNDCLEVLSRFEIKCQLTVTSITSLNH